jgi:hypothetical protein
MQAPDERPLKLGSNGGLGVTPIFNMTAENNDPIWGLLRTSSRSQKLSHATRLYGLMKAKAVSCLCDIGTPKLASKQTKEAIVAIAKESTIPTGGDDATPLSAPSAGAAPVPFKASGSGTLSDLLEKGDGLQQEPPKLPLFSLSKEKRTSTDNAAAPEPKRGRTEPPTEGSLGPKGDAGPPVGKPTLSQAFDIQTFAKGVEQEVKKMAKVAIQSALPGDKVLNDVVVRTIGDMNKTVGSISSTIEIHRETRNNAVYAAGVLNNVQSWQQKVDARLDELHNVPMGLQQKLGWVLDILRTFPTQAHGINAPPGMAGPYGYMQQWGPPMGAPNYAPGPGGPGFAAQTFGANMNPAPEMAPSTPSQPTLPPEPNPVAVAVALGKQPKAATSTPPVEAGPSMKSQPVSKKLEDYPDDQFLMVKSNSFSATHPDLNELKNKLVEAGRAFKVASTDVA